MKHYSLSKSTGTLSLLVAISFVAPNTTLMGQITAPADSLPSQVLDALFIAEVQDSAYPPKVLHAEPLYIDLIRDLGARKGEREWNVGVGLTDNLKYDSYTALVEYEWAPINRLGLEIELPFTFYYQTAKDQDSSAPGSKLNGLKAAAQYTFLVSPKAKTSLAIGYLNELEMPEFNTRSMRPTGNNFNPFFIAAKRWGNNWHTLLYTGPEMIRHFDKKKWEHIFQINTNIHYMISGTRNFIGVELNKEAREGDFDMVIRPQMRVGIAENLLIGIVAGIPVNRENQRFSTFFRLIYEPSHK
ncbi:MAG: hypothetical protein KF734_19175 [Saprospiraceae bacterium]|nr:hypothetical protein [Saprospiraceae bacterium]